LKRSAQKFDFTEVDNLEKEIRNYKNEIVQLESELNIKQMDDREYTTRKELDQLKTRRDNLKYDLDNFSNKESRQL
jgi:predicted  nucleic acid-binding Zn-ribbon protein